MTMKKILVNCTVLSIQDNRFIYPFCKNCLSRLRTHISSSQGECLKCGFTCDLQKVDHRYKLSLKVSRNKQIFGVTVFGSCLNPFFGIAASALHRFVCDTAKTSGPISVHEFLLKAVEDCFIGRSFVFGMKLSSLGSETILKTEQPSLPALPGESRQFVASQITPSNGTVGGVTVIAYLENLMLADSLPDSASSSDLSTPLGKGTVLQSFECTLPTCEKTLSQSNSAKSDSLGQWEQQPELCLSQSQQEEPSLQQPREDLAPPTPAHQTMTECADNHLCLQVRSPFVLSECCCRFAHLQEEGVFPSVRNSAAKDLPRVLPSLCDSQPPTHVCRALEHSSDATVCATHRSETPVANDWTAGEFTEGVYDAFPERSTSVQSHSALEIPCVSESFGERVHTEAVATEEITYAEKETSTETIGILGTHNTSVPVWEVLNYLNENENDDDGHPASGLSNSENQCSGDGHRVARGCLSKSSRRDTKSALTDLHSYSVNSMNDSFSRSQSVNSDQGHNNAKKPTEGCGRVAGLTLKNKNTEQHGHISIVNEYNCSADMFDDSENSGFHLVVPKKGCIEQHGKEEKFVVTGNICRCDRLCKGLRQSFTPSSQSTPISNACRRRFRGSKRPSDCFQTNKLSSGILRDRNYCTYTSFKCARPDSMPLHICPDEKWGGCENDGAPGTFIGGETDGETVQEHRAEDVDFFDPGKCEMHFSSAGNDYSKELFSNSFEIFSSQNAL